MSTTTSSTASKKLYVIVARHGERWDYVQKDAGKGVEWISAATRPWDSPLSPMGHQQARRLGEHLAHKLPELGLPPVAACFSSPLLRCRQTAVQVVDALNNNNNDNKLLKVQVELGLSESLNESWYRSWALPLADGTWGFRQFDSDGKRRALQDYKAEELHPSSHIPAQELLKWQDVSHPEPPMLLETLQDKSYISTTGITQPYALQPKLLVETKKEQRDRMYQVIANKAPEFTGRTILLLSHGGPVTHLYEKLTDQDWSVHGESKYCCYSIYEGSFPAAEEGTNDTIQQPQWKSLLINQSQYLEDLWSDSTANI